MRDIALLEPELDRTHDAGGDRTYQESSLIVWHDLAQGVGGVWRLSQEPVNELTHSCFGAFTHDGLRFRHNVSEVPFGVDARGQHHMALNDGLRLGLDDMSIHAAFPNCAADLRFTDLHPRWDFLSLMNLTPPEGHRGAHLEMAGRITGSLRLGDRTFEIDCFGHRDRSWGSRDWSTLRAIRWWSIVFGPDLAIQMTAHVHANGQHGTLGYMVQDGVPLVMTQCDISITLDYDGIGVQAGECEFTLENGEQFRFTHERTSGVVLDVKNYRAVESIGTVRAGNRVAMSNIEVFNNALGGTLPPPVVLVDDFGQGLSHR